MSIEYKILEQDVRIRTSEGEAFFWMPAATSKGKPTLMNNDIPSKWLTIPKGTKFVLCGKFEKTDTFLIALQHEDTKNPPKGIVLRRMSWENLQKGLIPAVEKPAEDKDTAKNPLVADATVVESKDENDNEITGDTVAENAAADATVAEENEDKSEAA